MHPSLHNFLFSLNIRFAINNRKKKTGNKNRSIYQYIFGRKASWGNKTLVIKCQSIYKLLLSRVSGKPILIEPPDSYQRNSVTRPSYVRPIAKRWIRRSLEVFRTDDWTKKKNKSLPYNDCFAGNGENLCGLAAPDKRRTFRVV